MASNANFLTNGEGKPPGSKFRQSVTFSSFSNVIDGQLSRGDTFHKGVDPVTELELWDIPAATKEDVDKAVASARCAFKAWKLKTWQERKQKLLDFVEGLRPYEQDFTDLLVKETGKPRFLANGEFHVLLDTILHFTELTLPEETTVSDSQFVTTTYVPIGVAVAFCPWNFPIALFSQKFAPALLCGNTIILKPSPYTPYSTLKLAEIAQQSFPKGVFQALSGKDEVGPWLTEHPDVDKIAFTGSAAVGKQILRASASTLKRVTLELAGNDAAIICDDIDVEKVASELVLGFFLNTGQVCVAPKRVYIHDSVYDELKAALVKRTADLKVGGDVEGVMIGPIQNKTQFERVKQYYEEAKAKGFKIITPEPDSRPERGYFLPLAIIDNPDENSRIVQEEQFGPIVPLLKWSEEDEVIGRANNTTTGLSGCVWSRDLARARRIGAQLDVGGVYINGIQKPSPMGVFGGHKQSGLGCEFRTQGLLAYCNIRSTFVNV